MNIINDFIPEADEEYFVIALHGSPTQPVGIVLENTPYKVTIIDDDQV